MPITTEDDLKLANVVEEMAIAAGTPVPRIYLIEDEAPNAFATGRDPAHATIAVTTGLRAKLTRDELQGVVAHELSHIRNYDTRLILLLAIVAPIFAQIIQLAVSRQRGYLADASAVELTRNPQGLADALRKIASDPDALDNATRATAHLYIINPSRGFWGHPGSMFSSHPSTEDRIQRLEALLI